MLLILRGEFNGSGRAHVGSARHEDRRRHGEGEDGAGVTLLCNIVHTVDPDKKFRDVIRTACWRDRELLPGNRTATCTFPSDCRRDHFSLSSLALASAFEAVYTPGTSFRLQESFGRSVSISERGQT